MTNYININGDVRDASSLNVPSSDRNISRRIGQVQRRRRKKGRHGSARDIPQRQSIGLNVRQRLRMRWTLTYHESVRSWHKHDTD